MVWTRADLLAVNWAQEGSMESHALVTSLGRVRSSLTRLPRLLYFAAVRDSSAAEAAPQGSGSVRHLLVLSRNGVAGPLRRR